MQELITTGELASSQKFLFEAGQKLQEKMLPVLVEDKFGQQYFVNGNGRVDEVNEWHDHITLPAPVNISTLVGLAEYVDKDPDGVLKDPNRRFIINVVSPKLVTLQSAITGYFKERETFVKCEADVPQLSFGTFMDTERFQVMLQSNFVPDANLDLVLKIAGSVKKEQNMQTADDGVSQRITVNAGVSTCADVVIKNPVILSPYRTFHEMTQPSSPFILRFDKDGNAALFTGGGSDWIVKAKQEIADYFTNALESFPNITVLA